eukprot:Blabericola_migrator_1__2232@NODE_1616_length_4161_cov_8_859551_g1053_i0_p1_GENE_NODE_1616_length_4161_cov_8_859551_g1053_i0NODE_1616_length_4161_cov_8_859551_g1053_i0_p1_ORF_typecomplete_len294_score61_16_NODE_1616_length_4161_cov_8_859551_g1053_i07311612
MEQTEARLKDAYIIGVKEWCAAALDVFISQVEGNFSTHVESSEMAGGHQGRKPVLWTQQFFLEETASQQRRALKFLGERTFKDSLKWKRWWSEYQEEHKRARYVTPASLLLAGESDAIHMQEELRFISGCLRNMSSKHFMWDAPDIAHTLKSFGAPFQLVNLLLEMRLRPEDVADYGLVKSSAQMSPTSFTERVDLPRHTSHVSGKYLKDCWSHVAAVLEGRDQEEAAKDFREMAVDILNWKDREIKLDLGRSRIIDIVKKLGGINIAWYLARSVLKEESWQWWRFVRKDWKW